jgi:hypothetical protein
VAPDRGCSDARRHRQEIAMPGSAVLKFIAAAVVACLFSGQAAAGRPSHYGIMAQSAWSAFQCSVLAEKSRNMAEQKRLFEFGYDQGLRFITALDSGTAEREALSGAAPFSMLLLLQGPTPDFTLGRIFEAALRSALEDVFSSAESYASPAIQESIAAREFLKRNCNLIGR